MSWSWYRLIRDTVKESYGIELRPEIRFLGSFV